MAGNKRFIDFDAYWAETTKEEEAPQIRVFGEVYTLPASPPAMAILRMVRNESDPDAVVPAQDILTSAESYFGADALNTWLEQGLTIKQLRDLIEQVIGMYTESLEEDADASGEGNPQAAKKAAG